MYDILIKNGLLIDGMGLPAYYADVAIKDDKIKKIGELHNEKAEIEIEASGKIVCPGFIDVNNHSDTYWQIFQDPYLPSLLYQGITTIVGGNCGSSLAPLATPETIDSIQKWIEVKKNNINWLSEKEFLNVVEKKNLAVNFSTLVGHATLRRGILRDEMRNLVPKEMAYVKKELEKAMKEGALGLSTGLIYTHARLASSEELIELAKIVAKYDGVYATHIRSEQEKFIEAVEESLQIARETGVKLHISHLKVMGEKHWPKMDEALRLIDDAIEEGLWVTFDVYPYTNTGSVLYTFLPQWVSEGGKRMLIKRLKDFAIREKVISEMKDSGFEYGRIEIAMSPLNKTLARKRISEIAESQEKSVEEAVVDILIASEGRVITSTDVLSEKNIRSALKNQAAIVATNGAGYNVSHAKSGERVHPRSFGAFIKVLANYVKSSSKLTWEDAIHKMTGLPAETFGIKKRGQLSEGYFADIIILSPEQIASPANSEDPYQYSKGVNTMIINGKIALSQGKISEERSGKVIR